MDWEVHLTMHGGYVKVLPGLRMLTEYDGKGRSACKVEHHLHLGKYGIDEARFNALNIYAQA